MNPMVDLPGGSEGGWSGVLDLQQRDRIEWECHVVNQQTTTRRFTNETFDGEMRIVDTEAVGAGCTGF